MDIVLQATQSIVCGSLNKSSHFHHRTGNDILFALDYIDFFRMWVVFRQCSDQTLIYPCPKHCFWPKSSLHCRGCVAVGSWSRINWFCHIPYNPEAAHLTEKKNFFENLSHASKRLELSGLGLHPPGSGIQMMPFLQQASRNRESNWKWSRHHYCS